MSVSESLMDGSLLVAALCARANILFALYDGAFSRAKHEVTRVASTSTSTAMRTAQHTSKSGSVLLHSYESMGPPHEHEYSASADEETRDPTNNVS